MAMTTPADLFGRFQELVLRADAQTKRYGEPDAETRMHLDTLSAIFDAADAEQARLRKEHNVFLRALRRGPKTADLPDLKLLAESDPQVKTMFSGDDTLGGFLASATFSQMLQRAITDVTPARRLARVVTLPAGNALLQPVRTGIPTAQRVNELGDRSAPATGSDLAFGMGQVNPAELFVTTIVSRTLLQDSTYPLDQEIANAAAQAFSLTEGTEFVKGTGVNGAMVGLNMATLPSAQVVTCADATNHKVAAEEIIKLVDEALKPQFLPNAMFLLNVKQLSAIRKLRASTDGPFLYAPGLGGRAGTILDLPYTLSPDLDVEGAAGKIVAYVGDFRQAFTIAVREDVVVQRAVEKLAETGKVAFFIYERIGGGVTMKDALARIVTA